MATQSQTVGSIVNLAVYLAYELKPKMSNNDYDTMYNCIDGFEKYCYNVINCRGSIKWINKNTPDKIDQYIKEYWDCFKKYLPTECLEFYRKGIKNDSFSLAIKYRQYKLGYIGDYDYWNLVYSWVIGKYFAELELIK